MMTVVSFELDTNLQQLLDIIPSMPEELQVDAKAMVEEIYEKAQEEMEMSIEEIDPSEVVLSDWLKLDQLLKVEAMLVLFSG